MRIRNEATGTVIPDVEHKESLLEKGMGLRFREPGRAFFSFDQPTRQPFDMLFVRGPLDIAFLDDDMEIMEIHGAFPVTLHPLTWRTYRPNDPYRYVLEVEQGLLPAHGFEAGHTLDVLDG